MRCSSALAPLVPYVDQAEWRDNDPEYDSGDKDSLTGGRHRNIFAHKVSRHRSHSYLHLLRLGSTQVLNAVSTRVLLNSPICVVSGVRITSTRRHWPSLTHCRHL
jgi:hypothetical protein